MSSAECLQLRNCPYYLLLSRSGGRTMTLLARAAREPLRITPIIREAVRAIDSELPLASVVLLEETASQSIFPLRAIGSLMAAFAALALLLPVVSIYGVISYDVSQRTQEVGIRMALGADRGDIVKLVFGQAGVLVLPSAATGLFLAVGLGKVLESLLYRVSSADPITFSGVALVMIIAALAAAYLPAAKAARLNPVEALRHQ